MEDNKLSFDTNIYNNFIKGVNIQLITLKSVNINNDIALQNINNLSVELKYDNDIFEKNENSIEVFPHFIVNITPNNQDANELLKIEFTFSISYSISDLSNYGQEYIDYFLSRNVPINIWPYARELISSFTIRMGYPALIIEPFRIN